MEQAEKVLREKIYNNSNGMLSIKERQKLYLKQETNKENIFNNNLDEYICDNNEKKQLIHKKYAQPKDKNILYNLTDDINSFKSEEIDENITTLNGRLLLLISEQNYSSQKQSDIDKELESILNKADALRAKICEIEKKTNGYIKDINDYENKIEEKKKKENDEKKKLKDKLDFIKLDQGKAQKEKLEIQRELEEKNHIIQKKEEEIQRLKKINNNISNDIKNYTEIIKYQKQLHNDIQPYKNQMNNEYQEAKGNMRVFCRIRPPIQREITKKLIDIEYRGDNSLIIKGEKKASNIGREGGNQDIEQFQFNRIFKPNDSQEDVFEEVAPLIQSSLDGYNINIFAYGQTGSGKTFTMEGDTSSQENYGIVPRSVDTIFNYYDQELKNMGWEINFLLSVCEIYNKKTRDLLGEKNVDKTEELKEMKICNTAEWNSNFGQIAQRRKVAETKMNMESSRSHLIFKIKIHLHNKNGIEEDRFGSLNLIDLAGSERVDKATVSEERFKESIEINSSLTHLKSVFEAMKSKHDKFIPFHNTPLTDVLKDCLSGDNSKTLMFVNISPLLESFKESTCSLKFATDVNKCYVSGNDDDSNEEGFDDIDNNYEPMDLDT